MHILHIYAPTPIELTYTPDGGHSEQVVSRHLLIATGLYVLPYVLCYRAIKVERWLQTDTLATIA